MNVAKALHIREHLERPRAGCRTGGGECVSDDDDACLPVASRHI
jgi:hypothetical protein